MECLISLTQFLFTKAVLGTFLCLSSPTTVKLTLVFNSLCIISLAVSLGLLYKSIITVVQKSSPFKFMTMLSSAWERVTCIVICIYCKKVFQAGGTRSFISSLKKRDSPFSCNGHVSGDRKLLSPVPREFVVFSLSHTPCTALYHLVAFPLSPQPSFL